MAILPPIRTAHARDFYQAYLNSPAWRARRTRKLQDVGWRCERCGAKRDLQVHHRSYDRLGAEFDADLEVLCVDCHETQTINDTTQSDVGIFLKLARQALRNAPFSSIAELAEDTKQLCADHHVAYSSHQVHRALELVTGTRLKRVWRPAPLRGQTPDPIAISAQEAHEILCRLELPMFLRTMPSHEGTPTEQAAHEARVRAQADALRGVPALRPKRRPIRERLDAIFAGTDR
jgi:hypothetical protein